MMGLVVHEEEHRIWWRRGKVTYFSCLKTRCNNMIIKQKCCVIPPPFPMPHDNADDVNGGGMAVAPPLPSSPYTFLPAVKRAQPKPYLKKFPKI